MKATAIVLLLAASPISLDAQDAQDRPSNTLFASVERDFGLASGVGGEVVWVQSITNRTSVVVGGESTSLGGASWTYGRLGGFTTRRRTTVLATIDLGGGAQAGDHFRYARYLGAVTAPLSHQLYAELEAQDVRATHAETRVAKLGGAYLGLRRTALRLAFYHSSTGAAAWRYLSARGDISLGRIGLATGVTAGTQEAPARTAVLQLISHTSQDVFVAMSINSGRVQTICAMEAIRQPGGRMGRTLVTWRIPVGSRRPLQAEVPDDPSRQP